MTLTFHLITPKSIWIIFGSWPSMVQRKVYTDEISSKLIGGKAFANAGRTDGRTGGQRAPLHNTTEGPFARIKRGYVLVLSRKRCSLVSVIYTGYVKELGLSCVVGAAVSFTMGH